MIPLRLEEIAKATTGELVGGDPDTVFDKVTTDSRAVSTGSLFVALKGERFDAHDFLRDVAAAGAVVISRRQCLASLNLPAIVVADTRKALGALASDVRDRMSARVIAIGGSNGKTTTKHLVGSVLSSRLVGTQSPKSFNNDVGVPLTILGVSHNDAYVVLELGTNHPGELAPLSQMSRPEIAAITSIGPEHLEGFGDLAGVRDEELRLLDGLRPGGLCVANGDDEHLLGEVRSRASRVISFGFAPSNDLCIEQVTCSLDGIHFRVRGIVEEFDLPLPGRHNATNALAALAIGREFGIPVSHIRDSLASCSRPEMRMQLQRVNGYTILNDAYNANPASMRAALETLSDAEVPGRRIAVLGEMRELGDFSEAMHREIGALAAQSKISLLVAVGAPSLLDAAVAAGFSPASAIRVASAEEAAAIVPGMLRDGDTVLLKASRGVHLEKVAGAIAGGSTPS